MKKLISIMITLSLFVGLMAPASAITKEPATDNLLTELICIDGESTEIRYREENGYLVYAEIGTDVVEKIGNIVYLNGAEIATITREPLTKPATSRTGWMRQDNCPYGSPSEYTRDFGTNVVNIAFNAIVKNVSVFTLLSVFAASIGLAFGTEWGELFITNIMYDMNWEEARNVYCLEHEWRHEVVPFVAKIDLSFYQDRNCTLKVSSVDSVVYASWS